MKILFLSGKNSECEKLLSFFRSAVEEVVCVVEQVMFQEVEEINPEIIVSYGYRFF